MRGRKGETMDDLAEPGVDERVSLAGETPALRLVSLLEFISTRDQIFTLQSLVVQTGLPKPTLHRMLQQLEGAGLLTRHSDGRHYGTGARLRRMAEDVLLNDSRQGARRMILSQLSERIEESCNLTAVSGDEVIYLDRVETSHPLRVHLEAGSRVPIHASASGKMIVSQYGDTPRRRLLSSSPLKEFTPYTVTDPAELEAELESVRSSGYALDRQEYPRRTRLPRRAHPHRYRSVEPGLGDPGSRGPEVDRRPRRTAAGGPGSRPTYGCPRRDRPCRRAFSLTTCRDQTHRS
jgi:IclR family acetate operon transcriptional repressor